MPSPETNLPPLPPTDNRPLWDIWLSGFQLPALTAADELGIFTHLHRSPSTSEDLTQALGLSMRSTEALLNMLAAMGFIVKLDDAYHLNDLSRSYLLSESPHYWGGVLHTVRDMPVSHAMIMDAVRHDSANSMSKYGRRKFTDDWKQESMTDEQAAKFTDKMHSHGFASAISLSRYQAYFRELTHILDVGGGSGCYSIAFASAHPNLKCTIADLPQVCRHAEKYIDMYRVTDRVSTMPFDMFRDTWPTGHDAVFMSDIFHDWTIEVCIDLAKSAFNSLPRNGKILINEVLLNDNRVGPLTANLYSLAMLAVTEGKQYTASDILSILSQAGFTELNIDSSYGYYSVINGHKPA